MAGGYAKFVDSGDHMSEKSQRPKKNIFKERFSRSIGKKIKSRNCCLIKPLLYAQFQKNLWSGFRDVVLRMDA